MRQIGSLTNQRDAQRLAAFLITQGIDAHTEQDTGEWAIWVRDENRLEEAKEHLAQFRFDPQDSRYRSAEREAEAIRRQEAERRAAARKNLIEIGRRWQQPMARRAPLTVTLIALSILVTLVGNFGKAEAGIGRMINEQLFFCRKTDFVRSGNNPIASVAKGQLWRTVTPILMHLGPIHILFNMIWLFQFGTMIESLKGTVHLALLILCVALISNVAQAVAPVPLGGTPFFGGMSGVVYGLFGYIWIKSWFGPEPGFMLNQGTILILLGWLFLCMTPAIGNVANVAHVVGLVIGMAYGYVPRLTQL
jgi:GlpG protein